MPPLGTLQPALDAKGSGKEGGLKGRYEGYMMSWLVPALAQKRRSVLSPGAIPNEPEGRMRESAQTHVT